MKTFGKLAFSIVSFFLSAWAAYAWWLHNWDLVWILMVSILLHEVGHFIVLYVYGLKPSMFFVPMLGAAVSAPNWSQKLNHQQRAVVAFAGPLVNFSLMIVGYIWKLSGNDYGIQLASLNAGLCWFNLIPFFMLDGKKLMDSVYASLNEKGDEVVASIVGVITLLVGLGLAIAGKFGFFYLLIYYGVKKGAIDDNPNDAYSDKAMSSDTAHRLVAGYVAIMFISMVVAAFLPTFSK